MSKWLAVILFGVALSYGTAKFMVSMESERQVSDELVTDKKDSPKAIEPVKQIKINIDKEQAIKQPTTESEVDVLIQHPILDPTPKVYRWKSLDGAINVSDKPPLTGQYLEGSLIVDSLSDTNLTVVDMKYSKASPSRNITPVKKRSVYSSRISKVSKFRLLEQNPQACRWTVGRGYDLYYKIKAHLGNRRSTWCDEFIERKAELKIIRRKGSYCHFPFQRPLSCSK